ncbi:MAG TPA: hypothetical protein DD706_24550 [Nitrospiraceae bacterium]|nr:hypothetical protein [Nitrospiraceae bacterium]
MNEDKVIRDSVHDLIQFSGASKLDQFLLKIIDAPEFQRLRRIKQLAMSNLVYQGADHTRFAHSVGAMWMARRLVRHLRTQSKASFTDEEECLVTLAALLHDIGHGPFSHAFEGVTKERHEFRTGEIISDPDTTINKILKEFDPIAPEEIENIILKQSEKNHLSTIVSSQLDADRLDYIARDTLMTGAKYGRFDLEWLFHTITFNPIKKCLVVSYKGLSAVEAYLIARHNLYKNVYFHKTVRSAEIMLRKALQRAKQLVKEGKLKLEQLEYLPICNLLSDKKVELKYYLELDDSMILQVLKSWRNHPDKTLSYLANGIINRHLLKAIDLTDIKSYEEINHVHKTSKEEVSRQNFDPEYFCVMDEPKDIAYKSYSPDEDEPDTVVYIQSREGSLNEVSRISSTIRSLSEQLMMHRLYVPEEARDKINLVLNSEPNFRGKNNE